MISGTSEILQELNSRLSDIFGERMVSLYLYGSHARNEAQPGSDIDVMVVMDKNYDYGELIQQSSMAVADLSLLHDVVISRVFISLDQLEQVDNPFLANVRREGVLL